MENKNPGIVLIFWGLLLLAATAQANNRKGPIIEKIVVEGNSNFSDGKIKDQMSLKENRWYTLFKKRRFSSKKAELDEASLDSLYHVNGFLAAESEIRAEETKEDSCVVKVTISEGYQTRLGNVRLEGGLPQFEEETRKEMRPLKSGEPFNWTKLYDVRFSIGTIYANNGYPYAVVQILTSEGESGDRLDVTLKISAQKKVFFGNVTYEGLKLTRQNVARRELTVKEGEVYSREKIMDSRQRLYSTRLFNYITLKAKDVEQKPDKPDFVLRVVEKKPYYVGGRVEVAQSKPPEGETERELTLDFTGEWGNRNIAGTSRKIGLAAYYSFTIEPEINEIKRLSNRFSLRGVEPWFLGTRTVLDVDLYYEPGVRSVVQEYRIESYGGDLNFSREFTRYTKAWLTGSYEQVNIYSIPPEEEETYREEQRINVRRKIIFSGEKDSRGNIFIPLDGSFTQIFAELVGGFLGGDNHFFKTWFSWARYNNLSKRKKLNVLATRIRLGYSEGLSRLDLVPSFDRFYMGGASTMRGFKENSMGPTDEGGDPAGGNVMVVGNVEYRRGLFWKFGCTIFVDVGNLWEKPRQINAGDFKLSSGVGIQFFTPVGPLRLDYGRQLPIKESPETGRFHLSILYAF
ncbi:MAG: outer membrane protein assembly factor BamA [Candidatus Zixiibacteriota bacterium]|nr:MAG: outer membrane protein assembly factor BamA [candidate division Zixibacteria bacterium]